MLRHGFAIGGRLGALVLSALAGLFAASPASAVNYEAYVGDTTDIDTGTDVKRFEGCINGGGTIMVGTRSTGNATREAELTMLDSNGNLVWRRNYQVLEGSTTGESVIAMPTTTIDNVMLDEGFAITGSSLSSPNRIYVLRVDCKGAPMWTVLLPNTMSTGRASGYDLTLFKLAGGAPEAIIVVGEETFPSTSQPSHLHAVGRIARVRADGVVSWDRAIDRTTDSAGIRLRAVTIAPGTDAPNIVAVGATTVGTSWSGDKRAFFYRIKLNTMPVCGRYFGAVDALNDEYLGVTTISDGRVAVVGTTTQGTSSTSRKVFLSMFAANMCVLTAQRRWLVEAEGISGDDIVETLGTGGQGTGLAITGMLSGADGLTAHISAVNPATLAPAAAPAPHRFGADVATNERLTALDVFGPRLLAGGTRAAVDLADGTDFYLVATDPVFTTTCAHDLKVVDENPGYPYGIYEVPPVSVQPGGQVPTTSKPLEKSAGFCCAPNPG